MPTRTKAMPPAQLGRRIRKLRIERGLSQEEVAEPEYTSAYISHVEHGKRRASQEALAHIADRLGLTLDQLLTGREPNDDLRLEVDIHNAYSQIHAGRIGMALDLLSKARQEAIELGHRRAAVRADEAIGVALYQQGDWAGALDAYRRAEESAAEWGPEAMTTARVGRARCRFQKGEVREGIHLLESHLIELQQAGQTDPSCLLETHAALIPFYCESGMLGHAKSSAIEGFALAATVPDPEKRACLYVNRAGLLLNQGERREALASLSLAEDLYRQMSWHSETVKMAIAKSAVMIDDDDLDTAEKLLRQALEDREAAITPSDHARALTQLAHVRRRKGQPEEGLRLAMKSARRASSGIPAEEAHAYREAGSCALASGKAAEALRLWRKSLRLFSATGNHEEAAKTARLTGDYLMATNDWKGAAEAYREGLTGIAEFR